MDFLAALFCLIMGPCKGEVPVFARLWPVRVRVRVISFTTRAVRSAILATAGLPVEVIGLFLFEGLYKLKRPFDLLYLSSEM